MRRPLYFMLRQRRDGPLVPGRLHWLDHEPGFPENKLDRGRLSVFPAADIAGEECDPALILDRLGIWRRRGDTALLPHEVLAALGNPAAVTPRPVGHWGYAQQITEAEYRYQLQRLQWAERNRPDDPVLKPRRRVEPALVPLPSFDRENRL